MHDTAQGIGSDVRGRRNPALANLPCRRSVVPESEACKTPMPIRQVKTIALVAGFDQLAPTSSGVSCCALIAI